MTQEAELLTEIERLKTEFAGADEHKLAVLDGLIEQAAYERIYLRRLNGQAMLTGLVKTHPQHPNMQEMLPVSKAITQHSATLTSIMSKLCRFLESGQGDDEDGLEDYE